MSELTMYAKVRYQNGTTLICDLAELADVLRDSDGGWTVEPTWMTDEEYERLPEFES